MAVKPFKCNNSTITLYGQRGRSSLVQSFDVRTQSSEIVERDKSRECLSAVRSLIGRDAIVSIEEGEAKKSVTVHVTLKRGYTREDVRKLAKSVARRLELIFEEEKGSFIVDMFKGGSL